MSSKKEYQEINGIGVVVDPSMPIGVIKSFSVSEKERL